MLKYLFWIIAVFALAVGAVCLFSYLDGNVLLLLNTTVYSVSLRWLCYVLIAVLVIVYLVYLIISSFWKIPRRLRIVNKIRKRHYVDDDMNNMIFSFFEGRYNRTLQLADDLLKNRHVKGLKVSALVFGAQSANKLNDFEKRDYYLEQIQEKDFSTVLFDLLRAEGALKEQDYKKFSEYCESVNWHNPKLTALLELQLDYGLDVNNADIILRSIKQLKKNNAISDKDYERHELTAYQIKLQQINSSEELKKYWKELSNNLKKNSRLAVEVGQRYYDLQDYQGAVNWCLDEYVKIKVPGLLKIISNSFAQLNEKNQNNTLRTLENWLEQDRENADLLLLLGELAYQSQLWGKAQGYLEVSINNRPTVMGWSTLSKLYAQQGEFEKANEANSKALELLDVACGWHEN